MKPGNSNVYLTRLFRNNKYIRCYDEFAAGFLLNFIFFIEK